MTITSTAPVQVSGATGIVRALGICFPPGPRVSADVWGTGQESRQLFQVGISPVLPPTPAPGKPPPVCVLSLWVEGVGLLRSKFDTKNATLRCSSLPESGALTGTASPLCNEHWHQTLCLEPDWPALSLGITG